MLVNETNSSSAIVSWETHKYAPTPSSFSLAMMSKGRTKIEGSTALFSLCQEKTGFLEPKMVPVETVISRLQLAGPRAARNRQEITKPAPSRLLGTSRPTELSSWVAAAHTPPDSPLSRGSVLLQPALLLAWN